MKTLLYATDLRTESVSLLKYAYELSKQLNVKLIVVHVYDLPPVSIPGYLDDLKIDLKVSDEKRHALRAYCYQHLDTKASKNNNELQVEAVEDTSVINGILSVARSVFADLILVGTQGKYKKKALFAGNIARSLVTKVAVPLMIVPHETKELKIHTIVYASALESKDIMALKTLAGIARPFLATIKVLHISTKDEYESEEQLLWFKELVQEYLNYKRIEYEVITSEDIFGAINKYVLDSKSDILAMLERKERNLLRSLFHQDLVKKMQTDLSIPLISFRMDE
ncbi:universal stress protein [Ascidiimonas sp. W6]|uniref:universal stress protein n=1 Tax=Ascidiimonas meishanensis TaxID=3128903 RepID=UPI0030ECC75A